LKYILILLLCSCGENIHIKKLDSQSLLTQYQTELAECEDREKYLNKELSSGYRLRGGR